jgi:lipoprotein-releasing system ATP-binding protein
MTRVVRVRGVEKAYGCPKRVEVLKGIDLEIAGGESVAIMGRSGEGKSTLLHIIGGLERACRGEVEVAGELLATAALHPFRQRHIGFIFQSFHLFEGLSALENVLMSARIARRSVGRGSEARQRAVALLEEVGLATRASFLARQLSGGERQRVAIARAFMNEPALLLADEPSGNLDYETAQGIYALLLDLSARRHRALIVATHDRELAQLCTRTLLLKGGRLQCAS